MPAQIPSARDASPPDPNPKDRPAKRRLVAMEGGVKTLFPDLSETTLIGPVQFPVNSKKFPVSSRREMICKPLMWQLDS
jgi:hypothetical protein